MHKRMRMKINKCNLKPLYVDFNNTNITPNQQWTSLTLKGRNVSIIVLPTENSHFDKQTAGADPGFCVRGDESRRGVWGPLKVSGGSGEAPRPRKLQGFEYLGSSECKLKGAVTWNYLSGAVTPLISLSRWVFVYSEQVRTLWTRFKLVILNVFIDQFWIFGH